MARRHQRDKKNLGVIRDWLGKIHRIHHDVKKCNHDVSCNHFMHQGNMEPLHEIPLAQRVGQETRMLLDITLSLKGACPMEWRRTVDMHWSRRQMAECGDKW
ncbi:unnamed protein product [Arabis nemorensis]|uniref:Uncharacterized protein n=1 Tax=Arabis nemorensis TaxID=586526 RepID=A0A565CPJ7_9BRAS|nr:unnamed protein product [Arabis nemorensis]